MFIHYSVRCTIDASVLAALHRPLFKSSSIFYMVQFKFQLSIRELPYLHYQVPDHLRHGIDAESERGTRGRPKRHQHLNEVEFVTIYEKNIVWHNSHQTPFNKRRKGVQIAFNLLYLCICLDSFSENNLKWPEYS